MEPIKIDLSSFNLEYLPYPPGFIGAKAASPPGVHVSMAPPGLNMVKPPGFNVMRPPPGLEMFGPPCMRPEFSMAMALHEKVSNDCAASTALPSSTQSTVDDDEVHELSDSEAQKCTVVMRNVPNQYTRDMLLALIDQHGFAGTYSLVYLPMDFATGMAVGYAFINFNLHCDAVRFQDTFQGFKNWVFKGSSKVCEVNWRDGEDDLPAQIERFRNCPMMHPSVPDDFRPALFHAGSRIDFPPPTQTIRKPRIRSRRA